MMEADTEKLNEGVVSGVPRAVEGLVMAVAGLQV